MEIKHMSRDELQKARLNAAEKEIDELERAVVNTLKDAIKSALEMLFREESLYEIRDYVEDLIANWEEEEIEDDDE